MSTTTAIWGCLLGITVGSVNAFNANCASAQITPDATLPNNSRVNQVGNTNIIEGGTQAGKNLFHSFQQFSVLNGSTAHFNNAADIQNIITRVTGSSPSTIDGLIRANGAANLFFLNPNGIVFGKNARLEVGGSFVATTANAIQFGNQGFFSADVPNNPALLTINPDALLFNQIAAAAIQNKSDGLVVPYGKSLLLVGGDINMDGGNLVAFGGRVELGGLAAAGKVGLNVDGNRLSLSFPNDKEQGSVSLSNDSNVNVSGGSGGSGSITINARDLTSAKSNLNAVNAGDVNINARDLTFVNSNLTAINAGDVNINARNTVSFGDGSVLFAATNGNGNAGNVSINAGESVSLNGSNIFSNVQENAKGNGGVISINTKSLSLTNGAGLFANSDGPGSAGSVSIHASDRVSLENRSAVYNIANSNAMGNSGGISITTGTLSLTGAANLFANTNGNANAGSVSINAGDSVSLNGSNIFSNVLNNGKGNGGVISINTKSLALTNGAGLFANTDGAGSAGSVKLKASDRVSLDGSSVYNIAGPNAMGNSGGISITTGTLSLTGANLFANTQGNGNAGNVTINAGDSVSLNNGSNIQSNVGTDAKGNGGVISINARSLSLTNGAKVFALTQGAGLAGSVSIDAGDRVSLENNSSVESTVFSNATGNSGGISIKTGTLSLTNGSALNTSTSGQGNGGNIILEARDRVWFDNSNLFTSVGATATGKGGNLNIKSRDISFANGSLLILSTIGKGDAGNATITTQSLSLTDGSLLTTSSNDNSTGNAGNISIEKADSVSLSGNNPLNKRSTEISSDTGGASTGSGGNISIDAANFRVSDGAIVNARTTSSGTGGSITIKSKTFEATNGGELITTTSGKASAGNIKVNATDRIIVNGSDGTVDERRSAFKAARGENLANVESASGFFVLSSSSANAGEITVSAPQIRLDNQGKFSANSASGNGGNIELQIGDLLLLRRQSLISTSAGNGNAGGNGGNININAPNGFVIAAPNESSNITANAFFGSGGKIKIRATGIFGLSVLSREDLEKRFGKDNLIQRDLQQLLQQQPANVITAISQQNPSLSGTVQINTPDADPSRGLVQLPTKSADSLKLIARSCAAFEGTEGNSFVVTGRGGLPPSPDEPLSADAVWSDTRLQAYTAQQHESEKPAAKPHSKHEPEPVAIVPATGWVFNGKGEVTLISTASNPTGNGSTPATCSVR